MPGWRWGSIWLQGGKGKRATGQSWAFRMVWLLVTAAVITRLGAFFDSGRGLETSEEMLAMSRWEGSDSSGRQKSFVTITKPLPLVFKKV